MTNRQHTTKYRKFAIKLFISSSIQQSYLWIVTVVHGKTITNYFKPFFIHSCAHFHISNKRKIISSYLYFILIYLVRSHALSGTMYSQQVIVAKPFQYPSIYFIISSINEKITSCLYIIPGTLCWMWVFYIHCIVFCIVSCKAILHRLMNVSTACVVCLKPSPVHCWYALWLTDSVQESDGPQTFDETLLCCVYAVV